MTWLEGKPVAESVYREIEEEQRILAGKGVKPGLAVILVGSDPASKAYVGAKDRKCRELGFHSEKIELPEDVSQDDLEARIDALNDDPSIHGILVQMPLPGHLDSDAAIRRINPRKDVDGLHPVNLGKLVMEDPSGFAPCTPSGCVRMLQHARVETPGKRVVVVGRSLLAGKSFALLMMGRGPSANATVTVAHSRTHDLPAVCREADLLVAAIGKPRFIGSDFVKEGAVVVDVGINRVDDPSTRRGYRLVGDVDADAVAAKASLLTPVPGGVGVMTIAMLMANTLKAARQTCGDST